MTKRLFRVEIEVDTVVAAESIEGAVAIAERLLRRGKLDSELREGSVYAHEINGRMGLPNDWDDPSLCPWTEPEDDKTMADYLPKLKERG